MSEKDWKYVVTINTDEEAILTGPFEDKDAADEFVTDYESMAVGVPAAINHMVLSLDDSDDVLAALKKSAKKAKKAAKKAAKQATVKETIEAEDGKKKGKKKAKAEAEALAAQEQAAEQEGNGGKKDKGKKKDKSVEQEADASDVAASPTGEAVVDAIADKPPATTAVDNGQPASAAPKTGNLVDDKQRLIEGWSRGMMKHPVIGPLNLSPQQRRVIAALKWSREVAKSNAHMEGQVQPPAPIIGIDANDRIVVQGLSDSQGTSGDVKRWAVLKNGDPADIKEPIRKLKPKVSESV